MAGKRHLFLALDAAAWGRVTLSLGIAHELRGRGDDVVFIASTATAGIVRGGSYPVEELAPHLGPLTQVYVEECVRSEAPDAVMLCDLHSCTRYFEEQHVDTHFVLRLGVPVIVMDIWNCFETPREMDTVGGVPASRADGVKQFCGRLAPVPINRPTTLGAYSALSKRTARPESVRTQVRQELGLTNADRAILFCTAGWQHEMKSPDARRLAAAVPRLLWSYLLEVDPAVRLIHVGPAPLALETPGDRYSWLPCVSPSDFDRLLTGLDMFLSANISATTVGLALASRLPTMVVRNSFHLSSVEETEARMGLCLAQQVRRWIESAAPVYPFSIWPLGYTEFLKPLLQDNPYHSAFNVVELLDREGFVGVCRQLLFDRQAREEAMSRQAVYTESVNRLPTAAERIDQYLI